VKNEAHSRGSDRLSARSIPNIKISKFTQFLAVMGFSSSEPATHQQFHRGRAHTLFTSAATRQWRVHYVRIDNPRRNWVKALVHSCRYGRSKMLVPAAAIAERTFRNSVNRSRHRCIRANRFRARDHWGWIGS